MFAGSSDVRVVTVIAVQATEDAEAAEDCRPCCAADPARIRQTQQVCVGVHIGIGICTCVFTCVCLVVLLVSHALCRMSKAAEKKQSDKASRLESKLAGQRDAPETDEAAEEEKRISGMMKAMDSVESSKKINVKGIVSNLLVFVPFSFLSSFFHW